jgi:uncharacterized membrane protein
VLPIAADDNRQIIKNTGKVTNIRFVTRWPLLNIAFLPVPAVLLPSGTGIKSDYGLF